MPWENLEEELSELFEGDAGYRMEMALEERRQWVNEQEREYQARNRSHLNKLARKRYAANRLKEIERTRRWQRANPDKVQAIERARRKRPRYNERTKRYRDANREKIRAQDRAWYAANKERLRVKRIARMATKSV